MYWVLGNQLQCVFVSVRQCDFFRTRMSGFLHHVTSVLCSVGRQTTNHVFFGGYGKRRSCVGPCKLDGHAGRRANHVEMRGVAKTRSSMILLKEKNCTRSALTLFVIVICLNRVTHSEDWWYVQM